MKTFKNCTDYSVYLRGLIILLVFAFSGVALAKQNPAKDYTIWKDTKFNRFFIHSNVDFSRYTKIAFLPMDYKSMVIAPKTKTRLKRSWSNFVETEMPDIAQRFDEEVKSILEEDSAFQSTNKGGDDVMIVSFKALDVSPKAYLDNGLATVGKSTLNLVGYLRYEVIILDGRTRDIIAMIEDDHTIAPSTRATGEQPNNIANHRRAWSLSMKSWIKRFLNDVDGLPGRMSH